MLVMQLLLYRGEDFDSNFYYQSGIDIDHSFFLLQKGKRTLFVSRMNEAAARKNFRGSIVVYRDPMETLSSRLKGRTVSVDEFSLSMRMAGRLGKFCKLREAGEELRAERVKKEPGEVRNIRKAAEQTREIIDSLDFKKAKTELDVKRQILVETARRGLEPAFEPIVATGKNTSFPHHSSTGKKLASIVLVDCGVKYKHYCSDLTRCFILDGDRNKESRYEMLRNIFHEIIDELPSLEKGRDVAGYADRLMKKSGLPEMIHSVGHGLGLEVHERPALSGRSEDNISGCTMAMEPAFYLKSYGMRFEETIYFDGKKARIL
ncbi:M24 family metallopeptidase [Candidatus Micrarchaeota archaeon]|nr:M24 family metallopeptidase [Candidatus Micrarchaeota archaeon]